MSRGIFAGAVVGVVLTAGCQRTVVEEGGIGSGRPIVTVNGNAAQPESRPGAKSATPGMSIDRALKSDPCSVRMHEISGAMLTFVAMNGRMPAKLEELRAVTGVGEGPLEFMCPVTGEAYAYVPGGLRAEEGRVVVLHDRSADAAGMRWVIQMQQGRGRQAPATWVTRVTERAFRGYVPVAPTTQGLKRSATGPGR
jgi:hypothetical protein